LPECNPFKLSYVDETGNCVSSVSWEKYVERTIAHYRKEVDNLGPELKEKIKTALNFSLLEPCQIEVLDFHGEKSVVFLIMHNESLPDMMTKIQKDIMSTESSEFIGIHGFPASTIRGLEEGSFFLRSKSLVIDMYGQSVTLVARNTSPEEVAEILVRDSIQKAREFARLRQVDLIEDSTIGLKKSIARIPEKDVREEILATAKKIDGALQEVKRIDEEISKVRQLVGRSKEFQDWKLLISDVDRLKGENVPRGVFESEVKRLDQKIDSLREIKFWSTRTVVDIALAIIATVSTIIAALLAAGIIKI
jgi:hypothetical protein